MDYPKSELFERLADIEHERWADWQNYLHLRLGGKAMTKNDYDHWEKQIKTDYKDLSEEEKDSDRKEVMRYWNLINK